MKKVIIIIVCALALGVLLNYFYSEQIVVQKDNDQPELDCTEYGWPLPTRVVEIYHYERNTGYDDQFISKASCLNPLPLNKYINIAIFTAVISIVVFGIRVLVSISSKKKSQTTIAKPENQKPKEE